MTHTTAAIVGAGHASLAMSRRLTERSIDHVVLERGEVANSWRTQRWPSLRLLTPNWLTRLPGHDYAGDDPDGGVLVVGASATGVQLAEEIHQSGHPVTIAVGEHVRLPRTYRGRDIFWWLEATGLLAERYDEIDDLTRARHLPSPQLTGTSQTSVTDLNRLAARDSTSSACRCFAPAPPPTSTAQPPTPKPSPTTSAASLGTQELSCKDLCSLTCRNAACHMRLQRPTSSRSAAASPAASPPPRWPRS